VGSTAPLLSVMSMQGSCCRKGSEGATQTPPPAEQRQQQQQQGAEKKKRNDDSNNVNDKVPGVFTHPSSSSSSSSSSSENNNNIVHSNANDDKSKGKDKDKRKGSGDDDDDDDDDDERNKTKGRGEGAAATEGADENGYMAVAANVAPVVANEATAASAHQDSGRRLLLQPLAPAVSNSTWLPRSSTADTRRLQGGTYTVHTYIPFIYLSINQSNERTNERTSKRTPL